MSRFIDTTAAVRSHAAGRSQSLAELQNRQGQERAAEQQRMANEELAMRQQQMVLAQQEQARQRMIDEGVANVYREQYFRLMGTPPSAPGGVGPVQPDGFEDFRGSIATAPLPVLRAMGPFISNRAKLNELMKRLPELEKQRSMIAPDSPLRLIVDHMIDNVRVGDTEGFEQAARQFVTANVKAKEGEAQLQQLASDMSAQYGIPMEEAIRRVRLTKGNIINESQNQTGATRGADAAKQLKTLEGLAYNEDGTLTAIGMRPEVQQQIERLREQVAGNAGVPGAPPTRAGWSFVTTRPGGMGTDFVFAGPNGEQVVAARRGIPDDLRGLVTGLGGYDLPQTTSTTSAPGAPTQAGPVADDATVAQVIKALTAQLGREPTDEEIDAAMEGV